MPAGDDEAFCAEAAGALARLPGVLAEARAGRFRIGRLLFHLAGVPTCIVVAGPGRWRPVRERHRGKAALSQAPFAA